jgi:hypothetical protein
MTIDKARARMFVAVFLGLALVGAGCAIVGDVRNDEPAPRSELPELQEDVAADGDDTFPAEPPDTAGPVQETTLESPWGAVAFKYRMIDGLAIAEGDVVLPVGADGVKSATSVGRRWPDAIVPYVIDANLPSPERVMDAIAHWESKTKLRFVPRTTERDYLHFRSATNCSSNIGQQGGRQFVNLTTSEGASTVNAVAIERSTNPQRVVWFYRRGFATIGTVTRADAYSPHFRYLVAPQKSAANVVDVSFASNGHLFAWFDDGTVSEGTREDFTQYGPAIPYALAPGKTPADVLAFAIDGSDRAYAFYNDGTYSSGTPTDLAVAGSGTPFTLADGKTPQDLVTVDVGADGRFYAFYKETTPHPDGGAPVVRGLTISSGALPSLGGSEPVARTSFPGHCSTGSTIHEIGHAIGLFHEQTRHDRDQYIQIFWENISPDNRFNFEKHSRIVGSDTGPYDFGSIMHYGPKAFSMNGEYTMLKIDGGVFEEQRQSLSEGDIAGVAEMYP